MTTTGGDPVTVTGNGRCIITRCGMLASTVHAVHCLVVAAPPCVHPLFLQVCTVTRAWLCMRLNVCAKPFRNLLCEEARGSPC